MPGTTGERAREVAIRRNSQGVLRGARTRAARGYAGQPHPVEHPGERERPVVPGLVAARDPAVAGRHLGLEQARGRGRWPWRAAGRPTWRPRRTAPGCRGASTRPGSAGSRPRPRCRRARTTRCSRRSPASASGLPHSSYSMTVSGSVASSIVVRLSTNGTPATTPPNASGARLATAPISRPPALPPSATSTSGRVSPAATRCRAQATKSVNVVRLCSSLPLVVPAAAHLAAAADVGDREAGAPVEQREPGDREVGVHRGLVGAVAVEQHRDRPVGAWRRAGTRTRSGPARRRRRWPRAGAPRSRPGRSRPARAYAAAASASRAATS